MRFATTLLVMFWMVSTATGLQFSKRRVSRGLVRTRFSNTAVHTETSQSIASDEVEFSVLTYNILAPCYFRLPKEQVAETGDDLSKGGGGGKGKREYIMESMFEEQYMQRNREIIDQLKQSNAEVICLQEFWCANPQLRDLYVSELGSMGYSVEEVRRSSFWRERDDGLAIFVRTAYPVHTSVHESQRKLLMLEVKDVRRIIFNDCGDRVALMLLLAITPPSPTESLLSASMDGENPASSASTKHIYPTQHFIAVNTHLLFPHNQHSTKIRLREVTKVLGYIESYRQRDLCSKSSVCSRSDVRLPVVITGDFNGSPRGRVFAYMKEQNFRCAMEDVTNGLPVAQIDTTGELLETLDEVDRTGGMRDRDDQNAAATVADRAVGGMDAELGKEGNERTTAEDAVTVPMVNGIDGNIEANISVTAPAYSSPDTQRSESVTTDATAGALSSSFSAADVMLPSMDADIEVVGGAGRDRGESDACSEPHPSNPRRDYTASAGSLPAAVLGGTGKSGDSVMSVSSDVALPISSALRQVVSEGRLLGSGIEKRVGAASVTGTERSKINVPGSGEKSVWDSWISHRSHQARNVAVDHIFFLNPSDQVAEKLPRIPDWTNLVFQELMQRIIDNKHHSHSHSEPPSGQQQQQQLQQQKHDAREVGDDDESESERRDRVEGDRKRNSELRSGLTSMRDVFRSFDTDLSGTVSRAEFERALERLGFIGEGTAALTAEEIDVLVASADNDGNGSIDYKEFCDRFWLAVADDYYSVNVPASPPLPTLSAPSTTTSPFTSASSSSGSLSPSHPLASLRSRSPTSSTADAPNASADALAVPRMLGKLGTSATVRAGAATGTVTGALQREVLDREFLTDQDDGRNYFYDYFDDYYYYKESDAVKNLACNASSPNSSPSSSTRTEKAAPGSGQQRKPASDNPIPPSPAAPGFGYDDDEEVYPEEAERAEMELDGWDGIDWDDMSVAVATGLGSGLEGASGAADSFTDVDWSWRDQALRSPSPLPREGAVADGEEGLEGLDGTAGQEEDGDDWGFTFDPAEEEAEDEQEMKEAVVILTAKPRSASAASVSIPRTVASPSDVDSSPSPALSPADEGSEGGTVDSVGVAGGRRKQSLDQEEQLLTDRYAYARSSFLSAGGGKWGPNVVAGLLGAAAAQQREIGMVSGESSGEEARAAGDPQSDMYSDVRSDDSRNNAHEETVEPLQAWSGDTAISAEAGAIRESVARGTGGANGGGGIAQQEADGKLLTAPSPGLGLGRWTPLGDMRVRSVRLWPSALLEGRWPDKNEYTLSDHGIMQCTFVAKLNKE